MCGDLAALARIVFLANERMFVLFLHVTILRTLSSFSLLVKYGRGKPGQYAPSDAVLLQLLSPVHYP